MTASPASNHPAPGLEWTADLTLEHEGELAARLRADPGGCVLELAGRRALQAFGKLPLNSLGGGVPADGLAKLAALLPPRIELILSGVRIGCYEPAAPLTWWSRQLNLPCGGLTIDKLALARAYLLGGG